jgi:tRNA U34 5-carboxymethylaminomethyl modifying GTPase MnmE/TrmE
MKVVIAGRPNAGKSSLLNALAGREAAIVTDIAGPSTINSTRSAWAISCQARSMPIRSTSSLASRRPRNKADVTGEALGISEVNGHSLIRLSARTGEGVEVLRNHLRINGAGGGAIDHKQHPIGLGNLLPGALDADTFHFKVVIAGRPNAGKSSLLNALAGREAAIVTDIAGTTGLQFCRRRGNQFLHPGNQSPLPHRCAGE